MDTEETHREKAVLNVADRTAEFPVLDSTDGPQSIDISTLKKQTGYTTLDYGFVNTSSTRSKITFVDGEAGILRYRGYPIEQLAHHASYLEVAWLLIYGELPNKRQLEEFDERIRRHRFLPEDFKRFFTALPQAAHPMAVLASAIDALSTYYEDECDPNDPEQVEQTTIRLLAVLPVIVAYANKKMRGEEFSYPDSDLGFVENFLKLSFDVPHEPYHVDPVVARVMERFLILHADHEQNASTSTVRLVGSTGANQYSSISAGINALFGPLHGGANEAVLDMLAYIRQSGNSVQDFVERIKRKEQGVRLMGFGHRVYKNYDPRAKVVKASVDEVLTALGVNDPLLDVARELENIALNDDYFQERRLYPNVDFYSGVVYKAMGFPTRMFTALFAVGRLPGWLAHWQEMKNDDRAKIGRPHQLYIGSPKRDYSPR